MPRDEVEITHSPEGRPLPRSDARTHLDHVTFPQYSKAEVAADAAVHAAGILFALIAGPILIAAVAGRGDTAAFIAVSVYVATKIAMFACSASYNLAPASWLKGLLRRLDHSAIFLKIAGTYTPILLLSAGGGGRRLLIGVWLAALTGIFVKLIYPFRYELLSLALYLIVGWSGVTVIGDVMSVLDPMAARYILAAGALYTLGVVFFLWTSLRYHNAIWHGFVLAGTVLIYFAILTQYS